MRITNLSTEVRHTTAGGGATAPGSALAPYAKNSAKPRRSPAGEPAEPLPPARVEPSPEGRPERAPEADRAAMRAPTRAALIAARISIRPSANAELRERGRRICDRVLADSSCRYRRDLDTMRIWGELDAVCTAIRRCERAMHHGSLCGFEFSPVSQADTEEHGKPLSQPTQPAANTNREGRRAKPALPPEKPYSGVGPRHPPGRDESTASA